MTKTSTSKRATTRTPKTTTRDDKELAAIHQNDFEAALTKEQIEEYESTQDEMWGTKRRVAMISLARSKEQLTDGFGKDDSVEALFEMIEHINDWRDHLKGHIEMAEMATARLLAVTSALIYRNQEPEGASV